MVYWFTNTTEIKHDFNTKYPELKYNPGDYFFLNIKNQFFEILYYC